MTCFGKFLIFALLLTFSSLNAQGLPAVEFEEKISEVEFEKFRKIFERDSLLSKQNYSEEFPSSGLVIVEVFPDSVAVENQIEPGDIFTHYEGQPLFDREKFNALRGDTGGAIDFFSQTLGHTKLAVDPGKIGIRFSNFQAPEFLVLGQRDISYQARESAAQGMATLYSNPEFSETCWARAVEDGYPKDNCLAFFSKMMLDYSSGKKVDSEIDLLHNYLEAAPDDEFFPHAILLEFRNIAIARRKTDLFRFLSKKTDPLFASSEYKFDLLSKWESERPPLTRNGTQEDISRRLEAYSEPKIRSEMPPIFPFKIGRPVNLDRPVGTFFISLTGASTPCADAHIKIRFTAEESGPPGRWNNTLQFALVDRSRQRPDKPDDNLGSLTPFNNDTILNYTVSNNIGRNQSHKLNWGNLSFQSIPTFGRLHVPVSEAREFVFDAPREYLSRIQSVSTKSGENVLEMVKIGGLANLSVNGVELVSTQVDPKIADLGFFVRNVGHKLTILESTWTKLVQK